MQGVAAPQAIAELRQARPALQSVDESQVAPRSLGPELGLGAQARLRKVETDAKRQRVRRNFVFMDDDQW
jgi:hypothetical protein